MSSRDFNDIIDFPQKIALQSLNIDVSKPFIAIFCAQSGLSFVHKNAQNTAEWVAKGVAKAGAEAAVFCVPSVTDFIFGVSAERSKFAINKFVPLYAETMAQSNLFDGFVFVASDNQSVSGMLEAAITCNLPSLFMSCGVMPPLKIAGKNFGLNEIYSFVGAVKSGKVNPAVLPDLKSAIADGLGNDYKSYAENSAICICEALGLAVSGVSTVRADTPAHRELALKTGKQIVEMYKEKLTPRMTLSEEALKTALCFDVAMGGSCTGLTTVLSAARLLNIRFDMKELKKFFQLPRLVKNENFDAYAFGGDGGVAAVLYELAKGNKNISLDYTAYDMKPMSRSARPSVSGETILPYLKGTTGRCTYLSGNLAEDGAVAVSGSQTVFEGKAIVFNSEEEAVNAIANREIDEGCVLIIRYQGPSCGFNELRTSLALLRGMDMDEKVAVVTDGRFSDFSRGLVVGLVSPQAQTDSGLALVRTGDTIEINLPKNKLNVDLKAKELNQRKRQQETPELPLSDNLKAYSSLFSSAEEGCLIKKIQ